MARCYPRLPTAKWRIGALSVLIVGAAITCTGQPTDDSVISVHVMRQPGFGVVPPLDRSITDKHVAAQLAADITGLPAFPSGSMMCPIDSDTRYTLVFSSVSSHSWSAVLSVLGCQSVKLNDGRVLWAVHATKLFADLGEALGLAPDDLVPRPCNSALPATRCYPQPSS